MHVEKVHMNSNESLFKQSFLRTAHEGGFFQSAVCSKKYDI